MPNVIAAAASLFLLAGCTTNGLSRQTTTEDPMTSSKPHSTSSVPINTARVTARVVGQDFYRGAIESAVYPQYEVEFSNAEAYAVRITRYTAAWPGNQRTLTPEDLVIAAGETRAATFVVKPDGKPLPTELADITLEWSVERAAQAHD